MSHDEEWLMQNVSVTEYGKCKSYHEHMEKKKADAHDAFVKKIPDIECVICNYTFKSFIPCKCGMRVTAEMRDAVLSKHHDIARER